MAKRVSEPLRNLDDALRVFHLLTFRSCGIVLTFFSLCHALEWQFRLWSTLLGSLAFAFELFLAGTLAFVLAWVERHDDEFYVPLAIRYYADGLFQRLTPRLLSGRAAGAALVYVVVDTIDLASGVGRALLGAAGIVLPGLAALLWLGTRQWPAMGRVVFGGATPSHARFAALTELAQ